MRRFRLLGATIVTGLTASLSPAQLVAQEVTREFSAQIHLFFDRDKFRAWQSGTGGPNAYAEATQVPAELADVPFLVMVSAGDCRAGPDGRCNVTADYRIFDPAGALVVDDPGRKVWTKAAQPAGIIAFSEEPIPAMLQSSDPRGPYRLHVTFHDNIANESIEQERTLVLEAAR